MMKLWTPSEPKTPQVNKFIDILLGDVLINPKVKMVVNDSSRLGPGAYYVQDNLLKKSPRVSFQVKLIFL